MDDLGYRMEKLIEALETNQLNFSRKIGVSQPFVSAIVSGRKDISRGMMKSMLEQYPNINTNWLLMGSGSMFLSASGNPTSQVDDVGFTYQKSAKSELPVLPSEPEMLINLADNLGVLQGRWGKKKNELWGLLAPGTPKQTITGYSSGRRQPPLPALLQLERLTGIALNAWLTRIIDEKEIPSSPMRGHPPGGDVMVFVREQLRTILERIG